MAAKLAQGAGDFASITWAPAGVPGVGDTADSNGYAVTITSNVTCDALVNTNAGAGSFTCSTAGVVITAAVTATVRTVLTVSNTTGTVTVTGAVTGGSSANAIGLYKSGGGGGIAVNGAVTGGALAASYGVRSDGGGAVAIVGDILGGGNATAYGLYLAGNGVCTITGNVTGATGIGVANNASPLTVSGTVTGGSASGAYGISNTSTGTVTVNTAVVGGSVSGAHGVYNSSSGIVTVNGTITGSSIATYCHGVLCNVGGGAVIATGTITGGTQTWSTGVYVGAGGAVHAQGAVTGGSAANAAGVYNNTAGLVSVRGAITDNVGGGVVQGGGGTTYNNIVYATKTGNWSDTTVWSTGALPGATTQVDSSGYTVTIDQDVTVVALFGSAPAAGGFSCSTARTITAAVWATVRTCLTTSGGAAVTVAVVGAVNGPVATGALYAVLANASTSVTGNVAPVVGTGLRTNTVGLSITVTGNVAAGSVSGYGIDENGGGASIIVNGNVTGSATAFGQAVLGRFATSTITVNGNVTGGSGTSHYGVGSLGPVTVNGQAIGGTGASAHGVYAGAGVTTTITTAVGNNFGPGGGTNSAAGVYGSNTAGAITRVYRAISGPYGQAACAGAVTMVADTRNYSTWQKSDSTGLCALVGPTWPVQPWYQAPSAATCVAAYDAVGANDLADSYVNEANPGTYNAAPGVAPTWTDDVGWGMDGATTYLTTGAVPGVGWSMLVRVSGVSGSSVCAAGAVTAWGNNRFHLFPRNGGAIGYGYGNNTNIGTQIAAGIIGLAAAATSLNGAYTGEAGAGGSPSGNTADLWIGARHNSTTSPPDSPMPGTIAALAIYSATLTQNDVEIVVVEMARLPRLSGAVYISPGMFAAMGGVRIRPLIGGVG